ncbi:MAG: diguanylate cyclase, partial [Oceanospirillales bacterium]|nr:diguanylate cyclase [Oceanospirillales bacterium]
ADKTLESLTWHPNEHKQKPLFYLSVAFGIVAVSLLGVLAVLLVNSRLKNIIAARTYELTRQKRMVDQHVIISETDRKGLITAVSEAFCRRSGYTADEVIGKNHGIVRHPERPASFYLPLWEKLKAGESWEGELHNIDKQGNSYWIHSHIEPIREFNGQLSGYRAVSEDITDRKRLELLSSTDTLTGIANRLKLDEFLNTEFSRAQRYGSAFSVILLDMDHFKRINDQFGHLVGDSVLKEIAALLTQETRSTDLVGRWGGEEFLVICPNTTGQDALVCAEKLRKAVEHFLFTGVESATISLGISSYQTTDTSTDMLVTRADTALYRAKSQGRNQACFATEEEKKAPNSAL